MDKLLLLVVIMCILILVYFDSVKKLCERFIADYKGPRIHQKGDSIRRWRSAIPGQQNSNLVPRQVTDDWWDRSYNSGIGFQLG